VSVASHPSLHRFSEEWLAMWKMAGLIVLSPWDSVLQAFAERSDLLPRRMAFVGLDPHTVARVEPSAFGDLLRRCATCESYERCEWDLMEDPKDSVWQEYCPNAAMLSALAGPACGCPDRIRDDGLSQARTSAPWQHSSS
jgi:hypothetical protein